MSAKWEAIWAVSDNWERMALVAVLVGAVAQTTFVLIYGTRKWWRARVGRALFLKSVCLGLVFDLSLVNSFFTYAWQEQVAAIVLVATAAAILYQLAALVLSPRDPAPPPFLKDDEES